MIKAKAKGVYLSVTEQSVFAARTSSTKPPFVVEEAFKLPRDKTDEVADAIDGIVEAKQNNFAIGHVSISPDSRFVRAFDLDTTARKKNPDYYTDTLKSQFRIDAESNAVSIIEADTGAEADLEKGAITRLLFCGAEMEEVKAEQQAVIDWSVYPETPQISSVSNLGAISDYAQREKVDSAILILEMSTDSSQAFIVREGRIDVTRPIPYGINSMIPVVKQELGLKDEESAKKLFFSNTFDFTEVGPKLLRKLIRELQASTGFYEVQTGQTIGHLFLPQFPATLSWVEQCLSESLGVDPLRMDAVQWLGKHEIEFATDVETEALDAEWFGLLSLMCPFKAEISNGEEEAEETA